MGLILGGVSASDLILDGQSVSLYVGGSPPVKVWPTREVVQITLGSGFAARDQFRAALTARGLDYATITEIPFDIELVGSGEALHLFYGCSALTTIPPLDTSQVTNMNGMFQECGSLVTVPPLDTSNVVYAPAMFAYCYSLTSVPTMDAASMLNVTDMFTGCVALTDGNVRLTNRNPAVNSAGMIAGSGLTREPWDTATSPVARKVTITATGGTEWIKATAAGDLSMIARWEVVSSKDVVIFTADVTCSHSTGVNGQWTPSGTRIAAGARITPGATSAAHTFTEII